MKDRLADAFLGFLHSFAAVLPIHAPPWEIIAIDICKALLSDLARVLGPDHPHTHSPFLNFFPVYAVKAARQRRTSSNAG